MAGTLQQHADACNIEQVEFLQFVRTYGEGSFKDWLSRLSPEASRRRFEKRQPPLLFIGNRDFALEKRSR
jgi:hypothetical protein